MYVQGSNLRLEHYSGDWRGFAKVTNCCKSFIHLPGSAGISDTCGRIVAPYTKLWIVTTHLK
jgi:hypothetical protein